MKRTITIGTAVLASLVILLATTAHPEAAGEIRGKVTSATTGKPIPAVAIQIEGTAMGALTTPTGEYFLFNVPPGQYTLVANSPAYQLKRVSNLTVTAGNTTVQDFVLEEKIVPPTVVQEVPRVQLDKIIKRFSELHIRGGTANGNVVADGYFLSGGLNAEYGNAHSGIMAHGGNTPPNGEPFDAMFFDHTGTNPFVSTEDDHLSTFAIDVDNASYAMTRSYLNRGYLPPDDAVRVEEFVNNFKYGYNHPHEEAFAIDLEGAPSKFGANYQMLKIGIVGQRIKSEDRKDANLVFVIDVSGSMRREDRLGLVRRSLRLLVDNLKERDRVGIVVYGSTGRVLLEPTSIRDKTKITSAIDQLYAGGSTYAEQGIRLGYEMADRIFESGKINRIILCSDGVANVGRTGADDILKMIKRYADKGITLSSIGFGMGNYNDILLEKLGDKGNGHYAYVDNWAEAKRVLMENLTGTLQVIARDVKIQVDFDTSKVDRYRLLGYENRDVDDDKFRDDKEDGGEIGSGHQVTALYEIKLKEGATGQLGMIYVRFKDPDNFKVTEVSRALDSRIFKSTFANASTNFKLAVAAAEFAEILRNSYWAKGSKLSEVLAVARLAEGERSTDQAIELMDLIAKADKLKQAEESESEPLGQR